MHSLIEFDNTVTRLPAAVRVSCPRCHTGNLIGVEVLSIGDEQSACSACGTSLFSHDQLALLAYFADSFAELMSTLSTNCEAVGVRLVIG